MKFLSIIFALCSLKHSCYAATARIDLADGFEVRDVDVDPNGNIWVCGTAYKTLVAVDTRNWGPTVAFIQKATKTALSGSTIYVSPDSRRTESCNAIAVEDASNIYIAGESHATGSPSDMLLAYWSGSTTLSRHMADDITAAATAFDLAVATTVSDILVCGEVYGQSGSASYTGGGTSDILLRTSFFGLIEDNYMLGTSAVNDRCTHVQKYNGGSVFTVSRGTATGVYDASVDFMGSITSTLRVSFSAGDNSAKALKVDLNIGTPPDVYVSGATKDRNYDVLTYVSGNVAASINIQFEGALIVSVTDLELAGGKVYASVIIDGKLYLFRYSKGPNMALVDCKDLNVAGVSGASIIKMDSNTMIITATLDERSKYRSTIIVFDIVAEYQVASSSSRAIQSTRASVGSSTARVSSTIGASSAFLSSSLSLTRMTPSSSIISYQTSSRQVSQEGLTGSKQSSSTQFQKSSSLASLETPSSSIAGKSVTSISSDLKLSSVELLASSDVVVQEQASETTVDSNQLTVNAMTKQTPRESAIKSPNAATENLEARVSNVLTFAFPAAAVVIGGLSIMVIVKSVSRMRAK